MSMGSSTTESASREPACTLSLVGRVLRSDGTLGRGEVRISGETILTAEPHVSDAPYETRIDVEDAVLLPGIIDTHVHALSHSGEGIGTATRSAAAGGVTTIIEMPFDSDGPVWTVDRLRQKEALVQSEAVVDVALFGTLHPEGAHDDASTLSAAGVACFKLSTFHTSSARFPMCTDAQLLEHFHQIARTGRRVCVHAENNAIIKERIDRLEHGDASDPLLHSQSRPVVSETSAVAVVLELASVAGVKVHFCHLSHPRSVDLITSYRGAGLDASVETCPHYLVLSEEDFARSGSYLKINPPLRTAEDREALWERLINGQIDVIASDHAPWPVNFKDRPQIFDNHSGVPGVETMLPLVANAAIAERGQSLSLLTKTMAENPARLFGLDGRKGRLTAGFDADVVALDLGSEKVVASKELHSNAGWSPYEGMALVGNVSLTVSRGEVVWDGFNVLGTPGRGHVLMPPAAQ